MNQYSQSYIWILRKDSITILQNQGNTIRYYKEPKKPKAKLHSFRVSFNNALRDMGLSVEDRQILLTHTSSETTKFYTHPNFDLASKFVNQILDYTKKVGLPN